MVLGLCVKKLTVIQSSVWVSIRLNLFLDSSAAVKVQMNARNTHYVSPYNKVLYSARTVAIQEVVIMWIAR